MRAGGIVSYDFSYNLQTINSIHEWQSFIVSLIVIVVFATLMKIDEIIKYCNNISIKYADICSSFAFSICMKYYFLEYSSKKLLLQKQFWKYCTYLDLESTENFHTMNNTYGHSRKTFTWNQKQTSALPPTLHHRYLNSSKTSHCQKSGNPIKHICGLGARFGCERVSEHSNRRD